MKTISIEICDNTRTTLIAALVCVTLVAFVGILSSNYTQRVTSAFAGGYEEGTVPGQATAVWVKAKK